MGWELNRLVSDLRTDVIDRIRGGLIVSCQAHGRNPLVGPQYMAAFAQAARMGGAVAIRANGPDDLRAIRLVTDLPLIGLYKQQHPGSEVYITPTRSSAESIISAGATVVALDMTQRQRPGGESVRDIVQAIRQQGRLVMADISTFDEGMSAVELGADLVATTLSGYTPYSPQQPEPDFDLVRRLAAACPVPVIAEGRIRSPEMAREALDAGACAVVVGSAITNPMEITQWFVSSMQNGVHRGDLHCRS